MTEPFPTYCFDAFQGVSVTSLGRIRQCCIASGNNIKTRNFTGVTQEFIEEFAPSLYPDPVQLPIKSNNIMEFINDPGLKQLRKNLLEGKKPPECSGCFKLESLGIQSMRQNRISYNQDCIDYDMKYVDASGEIDPRGIRYLDITLGNICNLTCRSCNVWASHGSVEEFKILPHTEIKNQRTFDLAERMGKEPWFATAFKDGFYDPVLPYVEKINFVGGEPMVAKEHYEWLEHIINMGWSKNISLFYNTNGTTLPAKLLEIWKSFKMVNVSISIDATNDRAHYIRFPSKWQIIEKNIEKLFSYIKENNNIMVQIHTTISCLNVMYFKEVLEWNKNLKDRNTKLLGEEGWHGFINSSVVYNIVDHPTNMHIRHLPEEIKDVAAVHINEAADFLKMHADQDWEKDREHTTRNLLHLLREERDENEWKKFVENTIASDKFRNIDVCQYIPWMKDYV